MMSWLSRSAPKVQKTATFSPLIAALSGIATTGGTLDTVVKIAAERRKQGATIYFIGNGGSAAIASHMAADWGKAGGFRSMCFNDGALVTCLANDLGYGSSFAEPIRRFGKPEDLLFAISSSGRSVNILNGVDAAKTVGMRVVTLSGFDNWNPLRTMGDVNFHVPSHKYGPVEIAHLSILHAMLDQLTEQLK